MTAEKQQGYILYTVIVMLVIIAATALLVRNDAAFKAGVPEREVEAIRADYVAEAAMQHALWQKDNYGCVGDATIDTISFGQHKYRASIESDATAEMRSISPARDSWIMESMPGDNFGSEGELFVKNKPGDSTRALYHYDLSPLAGAGSVQSATARFYVTSNDDMAEVEIRAVTADWTESGVNWSNIASDVDSSVLGIIPAQPDKDVWVSVDLTALAQQWVNDPTSNFGITLIATSDNVQSRYTSLEYGGSQKPSLEITMAVGKVSPVKITAEGALDNGVTRTLIETDVPAYKAPATTALQYDSVRGVDTTIAEQTPTANYGTSKDFWISSDSGQERISLLRFDLSSIPAGVRVLSAELSVKQSSSSDAGFPVTAHRIYSDWDEAFATWTQRDDGVLWTTAGGDIDATVIATTMIGDPPSERFSWDIRALVEGWLNGAYPNYGVALKTPVPGIAGAKLDTSDHGDNKRFPSLTIEYACECGTACVAPMGSGRILMVIGDDPLNPSARDVTLRDHFDEWGYVVTLIQDEALQAEFDASIGLSDAVFVSSSVDVANLGAKLTNTFIGVVNANGALNDELGIASGAAWPVGDEVDIVDVGHYITSVFPVGPVAINRGYMEGMTTSGTVSPGAQRLADWGSEGALLALEAGDVFWKAGSAAGRRVMLPLGRESKVHPDYWTNSGALLVQRSLAWATEADVAGRRLLMVVDNSANLSAADVAEIAKLESFGYSVRPINSNASGEQLETAAKLNDVVYVTERAKDNQLDSKLAGVSTGVVLGQGALVDEFGFADGVAWNSGDSLGVDNSYFVTSPLPNGQVSILSSSNDVATLSGNVAPGLEVIATTGNGSALVALETGTATTVGPAAGRRILLPWSSSGFDVNDLNASGLEIFERAIRWAADASGTISSVYTFSTEKDAELAGLAFEEEDIVDYKPWSDTASLRFDGGNKLKKGKVSALHVLADGKMLIGTKGDGELGGLEFEGGDLVRYDPVLDTAVLVFDGEDLFGDDKQKITSVHLLGNGNLVLSTDKGSTLGGLTFGDKDLVEYDPATDTATLFLDAGETTLNNKITAVHILPNANLVLSTKGATTLGGLSFDATDLIEYDPARDVATLIFDGSELFDDDEKINSVHIGAGSGTFGGARGGVCDGNFLDEFNSVSFAGSDGSFGWTDDWQEVGESDGAGAGDVEISNDVSNFQLVVGDNDNGGEGVLRELDLSDSASATLDYDFRRDLKKNSDYVIVSVRDASTGAGWTELTRHEGPAEDGSYQSASFDISSHASEHTQIRILTASTMGNNEKVWFDNIEAVCTP